MSLCLVTVVAFANKIVAGITFAFFISCWVLFYQFSVEQKQLHIACTQKMEVCKRNSCVHGYHHYKNIWDAVIGEESQCKR